MKKRNLILILIGLIACILLYFIFSNIFLNKIWYKDFDKDGFGDPTIFVEKNIQPIGYVNNGDDMNVFLSQLKIALVITIKLMILNLQNQRLKMILENQSKQTLLSKRD